MKLFPAIDLYDGLVVRLTRGDYDRMEIFGQDPLAIARAFEAAGAKYLHAVDLEGAKEGTTPNFEAIRRIVAGTGLRVQAGGGVRDAETVGAYLDAGVFRVILGTAAITKPGFVGEMVRAHGAGIAVAVDLHNGKVATHGWTQTSELDAAEFCAGLEAEGVNTIICTDIARDGVLGGTNLELYRSLVARFSMDIIASGGVSSLEDISSLREAGLYGAILGKALYTGDVDLAEGLGEAGEQ